MKITSRCIQPCAASIQALEANISQTSTPAAPLKVTEHVKKLTGIAGCHLVPLQQLAKQLNCIIGIRPVETAATGLIEDGHPTKDLHIKGKSANWGPQAGMICVDQAFSKLEGYRKSDPACIEKFNGQTRQCIEGGHAVAVPLVISRERMRTLLAADLITAMHLPDARGRISFSAKAPSGGLYKFEAIPAAGVVDGLYRIHQQGQPLEVLAKTPDGKALTADYDLHLIGPHISDLGPQDNLQVPDVAHDIFKARINGYSNRATDSRPKNLAMELREPYANASSFYHKADPNIGNSTRRVTAMIPLINTVLVGEGKPLVHHATEQGNPVCDCRANYPSTLFLPFKIGEFDEICVIENSLQMSRFFQQAKNSGYHIQSNPLWEPEITNIRRLDFTNSQRLPKFD